MNGPPLPDPDLIRPTRFVPTRDTADTRSWGARHRVGIAAAAAAAVVLWFLWFIFTAKSVRILTDPVAANVSIAGGFALSLGEVQVLREGTYRLVARAPGYHDFETNLEVGEARNQTFELALEKLPGRVTFLSTPPGATVTVDGRELGTTPLAGVEVPAGPHEVAMALARYQPATTEVEVEGREIAQDLALELAPNWADVSVSSQPPGAVISVDGEPVGETPSRVEVLAGMRQLHVKLQGYNAWEEELDVRPQTTIDLPPIELEPADGLLTVVTRPAKAGVMVDGVYRGESPVEVSLKPGRRYQVRAFKTGHEPVESTVNVAANREERLDLRLEPLVGQVIVRAVPADAELVVNGARRGNADQTLSLPAVPHTIEVRKPGYAGYSTKLTPQPGLTQEVKVKLLTVEEARIAALTPRITSPIGQELALIDPGQFTMGSSRREPGRRANEVLREAEVTRLFYVGLKEVTNAEFRRFASAHSSGEFEEQTLNGNDQPVVNVSWLDAALFCNWLSEQADLEPFYKVEFGKVIGFNPRSLGYRLPTEMEWEWALRRGSAGGVKARFPWGDDLPPPEKHGNYADRAAAHVVGRIVFGYNDNHIVSAPVGTFGADNNGLFDMAGNVAEWTHDYYEIPPAEPVKDSLGPDSGEYHVIRGSSWMQGTITDLRTSFRDYGTEGRPDVGFRIARFAE